MTNGLFQTEAGLLCCEVITCGLLTVLSKLDLDDSEKGSSLSYMFSLR